MAGRLWRILVFALHLDTVIAYIRNQEKHHANKSFKKEYFTLLKKFDVAYDPEGWRRSPLRL